MSNTFNNLSIMKTNKLLLMAAVTCAAFTSCSVEDNSSNHEPTTPVKTVASFEYQKLNADGFWCGDETGVQFDNWGSVAYSCTYEEYGMTLTANYTPAWASWSGYAISNRTATDFKNMTPDQFNNITGKAYSGSNFCVVFTFGESIVFKNPVEIQGFYFTNDAWTVDAILNGDGLTPGKFEQNDFLTCIVTGTKEDGTTTDVKIDLAKNGDYVKDWQWADLTKMGKIVSLSFNFDGSKKNDNGLTTPTYMCIDDLTFIK